MSTLAGIETAALLNVAQIVDGDVKCQCGADAVLLVTTEPDGEPGATCYEHAWEWIEIMTGLVTRLFGPGEAQTHEHDR